jgi:hypothetical protein
MIPIACVASADTVSGARLPREMMTAECSLRTDVHHLPTRVSVVPLEANNSGLRSHSISPGIQRQRTRPSGAKPLKPTPPLGTMRR